MGTQNHLKQSDLGKSLDPNSLMETVDQSDILVQVLIQKW